MTRVNKCDDSSTRYGRELEQTGRLVDVLDRVAGVNFESSDAAAIVSDDEEDFDDRPSSDFRIGSRELQMRVLSRLRYSSSAVMTEERSTGRFIRIIYRKTNLLVKQPK